MRCIVYSTDGNPDDQVRLAWSIRSLLKHSSSKFDVVVMSNSELPALGFVHDAIKPHGVFNIVTCASSVLSDLGFRESEWKASWPFAVLYRIAMPFVKEFDAYDSVIHMDTDTLVWSRRVDDLIHADIGTYEIAGAPDAGLDHTARIGNLIDGPYARFIRDNKCINVSELRTRAYINCGVFLANLNKIRSDIKWYTDRLAIFAAVLKSGSLGYLEQDFINVCMHVSPCISRLFNWFVPGGQDTDRCVIQHYCGHSYARMRDRALQDSLF